MYKVTSAYVMAPEYCPESMLSACNKYLKDFRKHLTEEELAKAEKCWDYKEHVPSLIHKGADDQCEIRLPGDDTFLRAYDGGLNLAKTYGDMGAAICQPYVFQAGCAVAGLECMAVLADTQQFDVAEIAGSIPKSYKARLDKAIKFAQDIAAKVEQRGKEGEDEDEEVGQ